MDISCPVCLNPFTSKCDISATQCGHVLHRNCIEKWLQTGKKTCPSCKKNCTMTGLKKLYFSSTGNAKERDAIQADLNRAESEAKRLKCEMAEKDENHEGARHCRKPLGRSVSQPFSKQDPSNFYYCKVVPI